MNLERTLELFDLVELMVQRLLASAPAKVSLSFQPCRVEHRVSTTTPHKGRGEGRKERQVKLQRQNKTIQERSLNLNEVIFTKLHFREIHFTSTRCASLLKMLEHM